MNLKTTLVLIGLFSLVGLAIWRLGPPSEEAASIKPLFEGLRREDVSSLELNLSSKEKVFIERQGVGTYRVTIPYERLTLEDRGQKLRIEELIGYLETNVCESVRSSPTEEDLAAFGLTGGVVLRLSFEDRKGKHTLLLGGDDAGGGTCYAMIAGSNEVIRTGRNFKNALQLNAREYRDDRIFTFPNIAIDSLEIARPIREEEPNGAQIILEQGPLGWEVKGDFLGRASSSKVMSVINSFSQLRVERFFKIDPDPDDMKLFGLDVPTHVTLSSGSALETVLFGRLPGPEDTDVFCMRLGSNEVLAVDADRVMALTSQAKDYRDRRLIRPLQSTATRLESELGGVVRYAVAAVGERFELLEPFRASAARDGEKESISWLLASLERSEAIGFFDTDEWIALGGGIDSKLGSLKVHWRERNVPLHVTLTFYTLENPPDGSPGEKRVFVTRDDEGDTYYEVDPDLLSVLTIHPVQLRHRQLLPLDEDWVKSLERAEIEVGERSLSMSRQGGGFWTARDEPRRRTTKLQSFISSLIVRQAARFIPPPSDVRAPWIAFEENLGSPSARLVLIDKGGHETEFLLWTVRSGEALFSMSDHLPPGCLAQVDDEMLRDFTAAIDE